MQSKKKAWDSYQKEFQNKSREKLIKESQKKKSIKNKLSWAIKIHVWPIEAFGRICLEIADEISRQKPNNVF